MLIYLKQELGGNFL